MGPYMLWRAVSNMDDYMRNVVDQMIREHDSVLRVLASNPIAFHQVYYCPGCQEGVTDVQSKDTWPRCNRCNSLLQWHYERDL